MADGKSRGRVSMTVGNPAWALPQTSAGQDGLSILALLDAISAPRALLALFDARSANARYLIPDRELAVGAFLELFSNLKQDQRLESSWSTTFRRGVASAHVSAFLDEQGGTAGSSNLAFAAGLLHDIGAAALATVVPKSYQRVIEDSLRTHAPLCEVERTLLGTDHTAAGAHLLRRWGACRELRDCAQLHHMPWNMLAAGGDESSLARMVNVADAIVGVADGAGVSGEDESRWLSSGILPGVGAGLVAEATQLARTKLSDLTPSVECGGGAGVVRSGDPSDRMRCGREGGVEGWSIADGGKHSFDIGPRIDWDQATRQLLLNAPRFCLTTDVCRAAAGNMVQVARLASCVVVVEDPFRGVCSGASITMGRPGGSFRHGLNQVGQRMNLPRLNRERAGEVALARAEHARIWHRCGLDQPVKPLWIRTWVWADDLQVLAIFEAGPEQIESYEASMMPDGPFAAVLEAMVRLVGRHEDEQLRLDTMLEAARRAGTHARDEIWSRSVSMISEVAAGAAHEINNPLAVISGRAQMELARADDPQLSKSLQSIVDQADRTSGIIMDLVEFAKPGAPDPALLRADDLMVLALQHWQARSEFAEHQVLVGFFDPGLTVRVDQDHFFQIFAALLENAASATDSKSAALHINSPSRPSDEQIRIVIEDSGVGMDARVLAHAAAPFFSNRTAGRGRGFGLSRASRLAEVNGGKLWLESSPNVGTRAIVALPAR